MTDLSARLEAAALSLTGPGPIKERLLDAYSQTWRNPELGCPRELGANSRQMIQALHQRQALPGDDVVRASVRKLSNDQACRYAELVIRLYGMFAGMKHQHRRATQRRAGVCRRWRSCWRRGRSDA